MRDQRMRTCDGRSQGHSEGHVEGHDKGQVESQDLDLEADVNLTSEVGKEPLQGNCQELCIG